MLMKDNKFIHMLPETIITNNTYLTIDNAIVFGNNNWVKGKGNLLVGKNNGCDPSSCATAAFSNNNNNRNATTKTFIRSISSQQRLSSSSSHNSCSQVLHAGNNSASFLTCIYCCERERNVLFLPCKHVSSCMKCYSCNIKQSGNCPLCKSVIKSVMTIHLS